MWSTRALALDSAGPASTPTSACSDFVAPLLNRVSRILYEPRSSYDSVLSGVHVEIEMGSYARGWRFVSPSSSSSSSSLSLLCSSENSAQPQECRSELAPLLAGFLLPRVPVLRRSHQGPVKDLGKLGLRGFYGGRKVSGKIGGFSGENVIRFPLWCPGPRKIEIHQGMYIN